MKTFAANSREATTAARMATAARTPARGPIASAGTPCPCLSANCRAGHDHRRWRAGGLATAILALPMVLGACVDIRIDGSDDDTVNGSGVLVTREFAVTGFNAIEASLTFDVTLTRSDEFAVAITADDNIVDHVSAEVVGRTLRLGLRGISSSNATLRASIGMPTFESLALSGASRAGIGDFGRLGDVVIELSGASLVKGSLEAAVLDLDASGASHAHLVGSVEFARLQGSGASGLELAGLSIASARVDLSGASTAELAVTDRLVDVRLSGVSRLRYHGRPTVGATSISGGAAVQPD